MEAVKEQKNNWKGFYQSRVNSTYQDYFNKRYKDMVDLIHYLIKRERIDTIIEEGVGIGSLHNAVKQVNNYNKYYGFDNSNEMLELCKQNCDAELVLFEDCIIKPFYNAEQHSDMVLTHGVLEHFEDDVIVEIIKRHKNLGLIGVHYVPLDGYETPSFGDERLLSKEYWQDLLGFEEHITMNEGKDLVFIIK